MRAGLAGVTSLCVAALLGGCALGNGVSPLTALLTAPPKPAATVTATAPSPTLAPASLADTLAVLGNTPTVSGTPTEVYERLARSALTCWFGGLGPLKKSHIFSAEAAPPSNGGAAEITVHERDATQPSPRGTRVFRIWLNKESDATTRMTLQTAKLPQDLAQAMEKDTLAWGLGKDSCEAQVVRPPPPPPVPVANKAKPKTRVQAAAR